MKFEHSLSQCGILGQLERPSRSDRTGKYIILTINSNNPLSKSLIGTFGALGIRQRQPKYSVPAGNYQYFVPPSYE